MDDKQRKYKHAHDTIKPNTKKITQYSLSMERLKNSIHKRGFDVLNIRKKVLVDVAEIHKDSRRFYI
jgi:hypothetical protein